MNLPNRPPLVHAGLDIAKATLDLRLPGQSVRFAHDARGCAALVACLAALAPFADDSGPR